MAFQRRHRRRRRRRGKRSQSSSSGSWFGTGSKLALAALAARMVSRWYLNSERKHVDISTTMAPDSANGGIALLNGLSLGTDNDERIGRSVRFTSVHMKCGISLHASATQTRVRLLLVVDRYPQGVITTPSAIMQTSPVPQAFRAWDVSRRYRIIKDVTRVINTDFPETTLNLYVKLPYQLGKTKFDNSSAGDITDIVNGAIYLVGLSDEATNTPTIAYRTRVVYIDN